ncbi:uncharacterized protein EV420DRAFT_593869 [Desarmillaria tabescens]|uniref:Uncharacterized protein n=1 Tax=Armillaria tabescens TaxID=1929756 RepID=A0AA39N299_ARMTA|nr:uncharacterized protein EV420DRAFT_593869 [Desarmillaria tabescens]KAK0455297.1 hypothetical protein EV420DRAFT_593869 [Desarmillaria tabescens]
MYSRYQQVKSRLNTEGEPWHASVGERKKRNDRVVYLLNAFGIPSGPQPVFSSANHHHHGLRVEPGAFILYLFFLSVFLRFTFGQQSSTASKEVCSFFFLYLADSGLSFEECIRKGVGSRYADQSLTATV